MSKCFDRVCLAKGSPSGRTAGFPHPDLTVMPVDALCHQAHQVDDGIFVFMPRPPGCVIRAFGGHVPTTVGYVPAVWYL
eukprot:2991536-Pyramimonas_sp.AAC.1